MIGSQIARLEIHLQVFGKERWTFQIGMLAIGCFDVAEIHYDIHSTRVAKLQKKSSGKLTAIAMRCSGDCSFHLEVGSGIGKVNQVGCKQRDNARRLRENMLKT